MKYRIPAVIALMALATGCGGGRGTTVVAGIRPEPWDVPLPMNDESAEWAEGEVKSVSDDGRTVTVQVARGVVEGGERIHIFLKPAEDVGPHYLDSEVRETRVAAGKITQIDGGTFKAEIIDATIRGPVAVGDKVIVRTP